MHFRISNLFLILLCLVLFFQVLPADASIIQKKILGGNPMYLLSTAGGVTGYKNVNFGKPIGAANKSIEINMPVSNLGYLFDQWISPALPNAVSLDQEYNWLFSFWGNSTGTAYFYVELRLYRSGSESLLERSSRSEALIENVSGMFWQYRFKRAFSFLRGDRVVLKVYAMAGSIGVAEFYYDSARFPSYLTDPIETRYMRINDVTVNGLTAKDLGTAQTVSGLYTTSPAVSSVALDSILYPTSNYIVDMVPSGASNYDAVNDPKASPDDLATYVASHSDDSDIHRDIYGHNGTAYTIPAGKRIAFLYVTIRDSVTGTSYWKARCGFSFLIGATNYDQSAYSDTAWTTQSSIDSGNPSGAAEWTQTDVRNMRFGCWGISGLRLGVYYPARITQVYVEIYVYTDQTIYLSITVLKRTSGSVESTISSNVAQWSASFNTINKYLWNPSEVSGAAYTPTATGMISTDSIVVQVYAKIAAGAWTWQQNFTTERLGANQLDANPWGVYYSVCSYADLSNVYFRFKYGDSGTNSRITGFSWTAAIVKTWQTAATWEITLITRHWQNSASWQFNLIARQWTTPAIWSIFLTARQWQNSAIWMFDLITRHWSTPAIWSFLLNNAVLGAFWHDSAIWSIFLTARQWQNSAIWMFDLITRHWSTPAIWSFLLNNAVLGAFWHDSAIWSIIMSLDTMTIHDLAIMLVLGLIFFPMCIILVAVWLRRRH